MKTIQMKLSLFLVCIFLPLFVQNVFACQCFGFDTPYEAYKKADAVFFGKVVSIKNSLGNEVSQNKISDWWGNYRENEGDSESNRFVIQEWFKGENKSEAIVHTSINMCQHGFGANDSVLVYAYKSESHGELRTGLFCSRTGWSETDIYFLRDLIANKPEPRIYGSIYLQDRNLETDKYQTKKLEGIKIIAQNADKRFETLTDKYGLYRFMEIPDGTYKLSLDLPKHYNFEGDLLSAEEVTLQPDKDHTSRDFFSPAPNIYSDFPVRWSNRLSGKVLDAEGKILEKAYIKLIQPEKVKNEDFNKDQYMNGYYVSAENRNKNLIKFDESGKTPGKYVLALEVFAPFITGEQKLRMYYPQATILEQAEIINIGESTQRNIDLILPEGFVVREIEGSFLWGSGVPIEGGWVSIEKMENSDHPENVVYDSERPKDGKFKFQVFENAEYWIHGKLDHQNAKPIKIKVGKTNEPIKLCITLIKGYKPENCSNN